MGKNNKPTQTKNTRHATNTNRCIKGNLKSSLKRNKASSPMPHNKEMTHAWIPKKSMWQWLEMQDNSIRSQKSHKYFNLTTNNSMQRQAQCINLGLYSLSGKAFTANLVETRSREIGWYDGRIALKFDRHLGTDATEVPVKFQSDWKRFNPNLTASKFREILR